MGEGISDALSSQAETTTTGSSSVHLRYGAHTDYQGFTLLKPDETDWCTLSGAAGGTTGGLEMFSPVTHAWHAVKPPSPAEADVLVVNVGDLLRVWSNDKWHSPLHRVRGPSPSPSSSSSSLPRSASTGDRCAIVFFTGPCYNTVVKPLDARTLPKYAPIGAGEHLMRKIRASQIPTGNPSSNL